MIYRYLRNFKKAKNSSTQVEAEVEIDSADNTIQTLVYDREGNTIVQEPDTLELPYICERNATSTEEGERYVLS